MRRATALGTLLLAAGLAAHADEATDPGEYVMRAAGCAACHTVPGDEPGFLAGGRPLETPFGTFYSPNITSDPVHGIGAWSVADLARALHEGVSPDGAHYYPVFPFTTYTRMSDADVALLHRYLLSTRPVPRPNRAHDLPWYFSFRWTNRIWKWLFFEPGRFRPEPGQPAEWNRGAYLVRALSHCAECHSPRNVLGALDESRFLAGNPEGPDGDPVPNITNDDDDGIGRWSRSEIREYLTSGMDPDLDFVGGAMVEVIDDGLAYLSDEDVTAIAAYLMTVPPPAD